MLKRSTGVSPVPGDARHGRDARATKMQTTHHSPTTLAYAQSLLDLASEQNQAEPIGQELGQLAEIIEHNPVFAAYLADPGISNDERAKVLKDTFAGKVSPLMWNFMGVLNL